MKRIGSFFLVALLLLALTGLLAPPADTAYAAKPPTKTPTATATPAPLPLPTATPLPPTATPTPSACIPTYTPGNLEVHFLDVGQALSVLLVAPSGKTALFDVGDLTQSAKVASYLQTTLCTKTVDYVVLTHYHVDHFGSYTDLLRNRGVSVTTATYDRGGSRTEYASTTYTDYYDFCTTNPTVCKRTTIKENDTINLGVGIVAKALCVGDIATRKVCGENVVSENDNSVLTLVTVGSMDVWLGGDTSGDIDRLYYADTETAAVNLKKIGSYLDVYGVDHHGSCYSTNANLVNATKPGAAVFSLGYNTYGHPCPDVVSRLTMAGSKLYYTEDDTGAVVDGDTVVKYIPGAVTYSIVSKKGTTVFNTK